jgi:hypothetical protein
MRLKFLPLCPACQSPHPEEVEPGTKIKCPACDEVYRAEIPEVAPDTARSRAAAKKSSSAKKKPRAYTIDNLGKLLDQFSAAGKRAMLLTVAIGAAVVGAGVAVFALVGTGPDVRPWVLGVGGALLLIAVACVLRLRFGGSSAVLEIHKKGVLYKTRTAQQFLFWEEMATIDIRREVQADGSMMYEVYLLGSETIHLTPAFLASLDDPLGLIKALKRHSGKDFEIAVG